MTPSLHRLWVYPAASPLLGLVATFTVHLIGVRLHEHSRFNPVVNPLLTVVIILGTLLTVTGTPYKAYFDGIQFVHLLLGSVMVALVVPLFQQWAKLHRHTMPLMAGLLTGSVVAVVLAVGIAWLLDASPEMLRLMASKSVAIPTAIGISEKIGDVPTIAAVLVLITSIVGATTTTRLLSLLHVRGYSVRGFVTGTAAHGTGTVCTFQVNLEAGAFSALGMGLNGMLTAVPMPLLAG